VSGALLRIKAHEHVRNAYDTLRATLGSAVVSQSAVEAVVDACWHKFSNYE